MNVLDTVDNALPSELLRARNGYSYPAVGLSGTWLEFDEEHFRSHFEMENKFGNLINSDSNEEVVFGYLSVVFWGHANAGYAKARTKKAREKIIGRSRKIVKFAAAGQTGLDFSAFTVREAIKMVSDKQFGNAASFLADRIPGAGFAFATKVCTFIDPSSCGVADSVIARKYPSLNFAVGENGIIRNTQPNAKLYDEFCASLCSKARKMNALGSDFHWADTGAKNFWRAVDIERALYGSI